MSFEKSKDEVARPDIEARANSLVTLPAGSPRPKPSKMRPIVFAILALTGIALAGVTWFRNSGAPPTAVAVLQTGPVERILVVSGRTETDIKSDVRSSVAARVADVTVNEGDRVTAGETLVILDAAQQDSRIRQAVASLDAAILREQSARDARNRAISLGDSVSDVTIANAERDLALAEAEVSRQRAALEQVQLALPDYQVTASIDGLVLERSVEPGDLVSPPDILMRLADTDALHVLVQIDEIYADRLYEGQRAWLQLAGRPETLTGTVNFVAAEVNELTGSLRVKLAFDAIPDAQIGLTTVANILIERVEEAVTVPRSALVANGSGAAVFVVREGRAVLTPVSFIDWPADRVEVTSGLAVGDRVILSPEGIADGQALRAKDIQEIHG